MLICRVFISGKVGKGEIGRGKFRDRSLDEWMSKSSPTFSFRKQEWGQGISELENYKKERLPRPAASQ